ncbi:hypothetical protein HN51_021906 [Arachis hypogaea]
MESKTINLHASSVSIYFITLALFLSFAPTTIFCAPFHLIKRENIFPEFIKWHVYIINGLNNKNLITHCKSKEDDMGIQNISPGSNINWSFRTDFFHSTLFWCHLSKDNNNNASSSSASIEVFWYDARLFNKCDWKKCVWTAKDDGIYLKDLRVNTEELHYRWDD